MVSEAIPGVGQVDKPSKVQDGTLHEYLQRLIGGTEIPMRYLQQVAWRYRHDHYLFSLAEVWAKHAGQLCRLEQDYPLNNWEDQHEYAAAAAMKYYADFVISYKRQRLHL